MILWYKNSTIIVQDRIVLPGNSRVQVNREQHTLTIHKVEPEDANRYSCVLMPDSLTEYIYLQVETPPTAEIYSADGRIATDRSLTFRPGDIVDVTCKATGYPESTYQWSAAGNRIVTDGHYRVDGGHLRIENPNHEHVHVYQCLADNGVGLSHVSVSINIQCKWNRMAGMMINPARNGNIV